MARYKTRRRVSRKSNPSSGASTAIVLGGAGLLLYLAYQNNWGGIQGMLSPAPAPTTGTSNPVINPNTTIVNAPSAPPPLGTVVTNGNDVTAQATAGYAYILPGAGISTSTAPTGYSVLNTTDYGPIFVRNNVFGAVSQVMNTRIQRAINAGAPQTSIQAAGNESLSDIQTVMSSNGLTGGISLTGGFGGW